MTETTIIIVHVCLSYAVVVYVHFAIALLMLMLLSRSIKCFHELLCLFEPLPHV